MNRDERHWNVDIFHGKDFYITISHVRTGIRVAVGHPDSVIAREAAFQTAEKLVNDYDEAHPEEVVKVSHE